MLWPLYLAGYRAAAAERSPADEKAAVQELLDGIADHPAVWISGQETVGIRISAAPLLRAATGELVSRAADLWLATPDGSGGVCVELNDEPAGRFWELRAWGAFGIPGRGSGSSSQKPIP